MKILFVIFTLLQTKRGWHDAIRQQLTKISQHAFDQNQLLLKLRIINTVSKLKLTLDLIWEA